MFQPTGMLTLGELRKLVEQSEIDTVVVAFPDLYGRLVGKRFDGNFFLASTAKSGTHACDYLLTVDMEMEPIAGYKFSNWESGYGDFHLVPDIETLRHASWLDKTAIVLADVENEEAHKAVGPAPRNILRKQIDAAASRGFAIKAGSELEYFAFKDSYEANSQQGFTQLPSTSAYIQDYHILQTTREEPLNGSVRRHLVRSGIAVECTKGEWGKGQHELNLQYGPVLKMADDQTLFKQCIKEIADSLGMSVTFMAKYAADQAGSSCHVHVSLWNLDSEENVFVGDQSLGSIPCSDHYRWFLGGWMKHVSELMVFYAPNVNSYKRYLSGSWAPTRIAVARDNRTAGFRLVGSGSGLRIECRIPGADCNPYLTYAAAIASGLDGIENKIEPPDLFDGDAYKASDVQEVPKTLREATTNFEKSEFAKEAFGVDVVEHYVHFFKTEQACFDAAVTDWERKRYFERI